MQSGEGMSLSEFMYPVLQSWDWWYMYDTKKIQLQIGGFDQFGNITAGIDAINYINKNHSNPRFQKEEDDLLDRPMGFTVPLLTTSSGEKFGKSAGNAIWLDKECTSSFDLYQVRQRMSTSSFCSANLSLVFPPDCGCGRRALSKTLYLHTQLRHLDYHEREQQRPFQTLRAAPSST